MEKQMVFPFIEEDNMLAGRTCEKCKHQQKCADEGVTISKDHTCGDWENDDNRDQAKDSDEAMNVFDDLMDKYSVSVDDRRLIYINCQHF
jgi:hypothetical protein